MVDLRLTMFRGTCSNHSIISIFCHLYYWRNRLDPKKDREQTVCNYIILVFILIFCKTEFINLPYALKKLSIITETINKLKQFKDLSRRELKGN